MLWRISAALLALYLVHGAENSARDGARLASDLREEIPQAAVALCTDKPEHCQHLLKQVSGLQVPGLGAPERVVSAPIVPPARTPVEAKPHAKPHAAPLPFAAGEFPLPPMRPAALPGRKGAAKGTVNGA